MRKDDAITYERINCPKPKKIKWFNDGIVINAKMHLSLKWFNATSDNSLWMDWYFVFN